MNKIEKRQLIIKIETDILTRYKNLCKTKGFNMSQRIRNFIEKELKNEYEKIN